jgi:hypothetical protein
MNESLEKCKKKFAARDRNIGWGYVSSRGNRGAGLMRGTELDGTPFANELRGPAPAALGLRNVAQTWRRRAHGRQPFGFSRPALFEPQVDMQGNRPGQQ